MRGRSLCLACMSRTCEHAETVSLDARLSPREMDLLLRLTKGLTNKLLAYDMGIGVSTVKVYLRDIFQKLRVDNRMQASLWAVEHRALLGGDATFHTLGKVEGRHLITDPLPAEASVFEGRVVEVCLTLATPVQVEAYAAQHPPITITDSQGTRLA